MIKHIAALIGTTACAALLLAPSVGMAADPYSAKAISGTSIYSLEAATPGGPITSTAFWTKGTHLAGIATRGNYAYVTDNTDTGAKLYEFYLGNSTPLRTINLDGVKMAGEVAVDNKGYVYVTDTTQNDTARFAVVYDPDWANPTSTNVIYGSLSTNWQTGVAAYDDGAVIVQRNDALNAFGVIGGTSATKIDNNGVKENKGLVSDPPATPAAVAVNRATGDVYIASNLTTLNENFDYVDQAQIAGRSSNWGDLGTVDMVGATILDLAFASDGTNDSLAMVGLINGNLRAWKTTLTNGAQGSQDILSLGSGVVGTSKIAASDDGKMLWVTAQGTGTAYSLDLQSWIQSPSTLSSLRVGDQIFDIATHAYVPMVPEPSSLLSLFALGAGAFGFMRKRR